MKLERRSITVRIPTHTADRLDRLVAAKNAASPGSATRTTVVCRALSAGLPILEAAMAGRGGSDAE